MTYYYNENERVFAIYTNFVPKETPKGFKKITEAKYIELKEQLAEEQTENVQEAE